MFTHRSICQSICLSSAFQLSAMLTKDPDESQWYICNMYTSTQPQSHINTLEKKRKEKKTAALLLLSTRGRDFTEKIPWQVFTVFCSFWRRNRLKYLFLQVLIKI